MHFRFKGFLKRETISGIVYRYTCSSCKTTCYGKIYCQFFTNGAEDMGIFNLTGMHLNKVKQPAVPDHLLELHSTGFDHYDILPSDANKFRLFIKGKFADQTWQAQVKQNHQVISVKTIWLKNCLIDFHRT